jgi:hypothetical protein
MAAALGGLLLVDGLESHTWKMSSMTEWRLKTLENRQPAPTCPHCHHAAHTTKCLKVLRVGKPGEDQFCLCDPAPAPPIDHSWDICRCGHTRRFHGKPGAVWKSGCALCECAAFEGGEYPDLAPTDEPPLPQSIDDFRPGGDPAPAGGAPQNFEKGGRDGRLQTVTQDGAASIPGAAPAPAQCPVTPQELREIADVLMVPLPMFKESRQAVCKKLRTIADYLEKR